MNDRIDDKRCLFPLYYSYKGVVEDVGFSCLLSVLFVENRVKCHLDVAKRNKNIQNVSIFAQFVIR